MIYFLTAFFAILAYRAVFCASGYARVVYYEKKYREYLTDKGEVFTLYTAPVKKLFKQAHISAPMIPFSEPVGYGQVMTASASVFDNMANKRQDTVCHMMNSFIQAKGFFRMSLLECFSPLHWVQLLFFLPSKLCEYLGISSDKIAIKVFQLVYWVLTPLILCFRTQLYNFVIQLLQQT